MIEAAYISENHFSQAILPSHIANEPQKFIKECPDLKQEIDEEFIIDLVAITAARETFRGKRRWRSRPTPTNRRLSRRAAVCSSVARGSARKTNDDGDGASSRPPQAVSDPLARFVVEKAAQAFICEIAEASSSLAAYERDGLDPIEAPDFFSNVKSPPIAPLPGIDANGRALILLFGLGGLHIFYTRRTRALAIWTIATRRRFVQAVKAYPREAARSLPATRARKLFACEMRAATRRDQEALS